MLIVILLYCTCIKLNVPCSYRCAHITYNCKGFNLTKVPCIKQLLKSCSILLLQETWLFSNQFSTFLQYFPHYKSVDVCGIDESNFVIGRPYGGCSILYCDKLHVTPIYFTDAKRLCGIKIKFATYEWCIFNVYMPCDDGTDVSMCMYNDILSEISMYCFNNNVDYCIIGGDFNTDLSRHRSKLTRSLNTYVANECLYYCCRSELCDILYTFVSPMDSTSLIDHFIVSMNMSRLIKQYTCTSTVTVDNLSDHVPVLLSVRCDVTFIHVDNMGAQCIRECQPLWAKANDCDILHYKHALDINLDSIIVPHHVIMCNDVFCVNDEHYISLYDFYFAIIEACTKATAVTIPSTRPTNCQTVRTTIVPGWGVEQDLAREVSVFWHTIWVMCERPRSGALADVMRFTRNRYHYLIRGLKKDRDSAVKQSLASSLLSNKSRDFWVEVKKMNKCKTSVAPLVDGHSDSNSVADLFSCRYRDLFSSVPSDYSLLQSILSTITEGIRHVCVNHVDDMDAMPHCHSVDIVDVKSAISSLRTGKVDRVDDLCSDNFVHASERFLLYISYVINCMLTHGICPDSFLRAQVVPIPKNRRLDLSDPSNYRAIAISSIFSKVLDKLIVKKQTEQLTTSGYQFGFKKGCSTIMCATLLSETIEYYVSNNSSVYVLLIDASKAFDRISHVTLFNVLYKKQLCPLVLRLLYNMYTNSSMQVRWRDALSNPFDLNNGVKQGGVLSPILFTMYIDGLIDKLQHSGYGCYIGKMYAGVCGYADDIALAAPTVFALRKMIIICEDYAREFSILFNPSKSKLMCYNPVIDDYSPIVHLSGLPVEVVSTEIYLGTHLNSDIYYRDIDCLVSDFNRRSNHLKSNFSMCDSVTLKSLHSTFCESFYGLELFDFAHHDISKLHVAWRVIVRRIFNLPPRTHNYIVSKLGGCIITRLERRLCKFIYNLIHCDNVTVRQIAKYKLNLCPRSTISQNYRYLCFKYKLCHLDWCNNLKPLLSKIVRVYSDEELVVCNTIYELCELRDGVRQCNVMCSKDFLHRIIEDLCVS